MILCMRIIKCLFIGLLFSLSLKGQYLSTAFVDTVSIEVDGKMLLESNATFLRFLRSDRDTTIMIYNDGVYKLELNYTSLGSNSNKYLSIPEGKFYKNQKKLFLGQYGLLESGESYECSHLFTDYTDLKNVERDTTVKNQILVKLRTRIGLIAPRDTNNYNVNYRQGEWVGHYEGVKEFSINYLNDRKHGKAQVLYESGTTYNTSFTHGISNNYGNGYFKGEVKGKSVIPAIVTWSCDDQHKIFFLVRNKKTKEFTSNNTINVCYRYKGLKNDSIERYIQAAHFVCVKNDTMVVRAENMNAYNHYREKKDSLKWYYNHLSYEFYKIPINSIQYIKKQRGAVMGSAFLLGLASIVSGAIVSPLISIQKSGFNNDRFLKVSGTSLGVLAVSITVGITCSIKHFQIKPSKKRKKIWKLIP
jgi:hypothetical protein